LRVGSWWIDLAAVIAAALAILVMIAWTPPHADAARLHPDRTCRARTLTATKAINCYWPRHSRAKALRVAECESTASAPPRIARTRGLGRWARNGQYQGIFQMGARERRVYGWYTAGAPARVQVRSAIRLYRERGWQPWACA
jgi:hypothetical protein